MCETYETLNIESLRWHNCVDVFLAHCFKNGGLAGVVQT